MSASLEAASKKENDSSKQNCSLSAQPVTRRSGKTCTEKSTTREYRDDSAPDRVSQFETGYIERVLLLFVGIGGKLVDERLAANHTSDDTEIVAIEYTSERGEQANKELEPLRRKPHCCE